MNQIPPPLLVFNGATYVQCNGTINIFGRCNRCGQRVDSTTGTHMVLVAKGLPDGR